MWNMTVNKIGYIQMRLRLNAELVSSFFLWRDCDGSYGNLRIMLQLWLLKGNVEYCRGPLFPRGRQYTLFIHMVGSSMSAHNEQ